MPQDGTPAGIHEAQHHARPRCRDAATILPGARSMVWGASTASTTKIENT